MQFAVNGTLMKGLALNRYMINAGAIFIRDAKTLPIYQLWSIDDIYPAMIRTNGENGKDIALEIWDISEAGLIGILTNEPPGLTLGRIILEDKSEVFGILAEPYIIEGMREITKYKGWRNYLLDR